MSAHQPRAERLQAAFAHLSPTMRDILLPAIEAVEEIADRETADRWAQGMLDVLSGAPPESLVDRSAPWTG